MSLSDGNLVKKSLLRPPNPSQFSNLFLWAQNLLLRFESFSRSISTLFSIFPSYCEGIPFFYHLISGMGQLTLHFPGMCLGRVSWSKNFVLRMSTWMVGSLEQTFHTLLWHNFLQLSDAGALVSNPDVYFFLRWFDQNPTNTQWFLL